MRTLYWKGPCSLLGRLVRLKEGMPYTHTELLFSDGSRFSINVDYKAKFYTPTEPNEIVGRHWDPLLWDCIEVTGGSEEAVRNACATQVGTTFDWRGIFFSQVFPWGWEHSEHWFCSEIAMWALQEGGYPSAMECLPHRRSPAKMAKHLLARGGKLVS